MLDLPESINVNSDIRKKTSVVRVKSAKGHQFVLGLKLNNVKNGFPAASHQSPGLASAKN